MLVLEYTAGEAFHALRQLGRGQLRRYAHKHMHAVGAYRTLDNCRFPPLTHLPRQIARPHRNLAAKNLVTALRRPNHALLRIPNRVSILLAIDHFRIIQHGRWKLTDGKALGLNLEAEAK
jgi:hypothetical protein